MAKEQWNEKSQARHQRYRDKNREKVREANRKRYAVAGEFCNQYKDRPCADCGGVFHYSAMDFDHRPGEGRGVHHKVKMKQLAMTSKARFLAEVQKCDVVCANCHRVRMWKRRYG